MTRTFVIGLALLALTSCDVAGIEMSPSAEVFVGDPAGDIDDPVSPVSPIKTLAIRPAYTKITGLGNTVQLTACVWLTEGDEGGEEEEMEAQDQLDLPDPLPVEWATENYGIASVDENGLVTAVSSGDTFIHVQIDGKEAIARVIVESESSTDPSIDITPAPP